MGGPRSRPNFINLLFKIKPKNYYLERLVYKLNMEIFNLEYKTYLFFRKHQVI